MQGGLKDRKNVGKCVEHHENMENSGIQGHFTNHSLRVTTATLGLENGIPTKLLQERTGHRSSESLKRYLRTSATAKRKMSEILNGNKGRQWRTRFVSQVCTIKN